MNTLTSGFVVVVFATGSLYLAQAVLTVESDFIDVGESNLRT